MMMMMMDQQEVVAISGEGERVCCRLTLDTPSQQVFYRARNPITQPPPLIMAVTGEHQQAVREMEGDSRVGSSRTLPLRSNQAHCRH